MKENCVVIGKQLIPEQMAQSLTQIEAYTGALLVQTTALLIITIIIASGALIGSLFYLWKDRKKK